MYLTTAKRTRYSKLKNVTMLYVTTGDVVTKTDVNRASIQASIEQASTVAIFRNSKLIAAFLSGKRVK